MNLKRITKTGLLLILFLAGFGLKAQSPTYNQLVSIIYSKVPGADVSDKIIAFVSWSAANSQSREVNQEFNRVGTIYQGAKLKNGGKGAYVISCNMDNPATATIASNKDGIDFSIRVNISEFNFLSTMPVNSNVVYDNTGTVVYTNLTQPQVFMSFNHLVTR